MCETYFPTNCTMWHTRTVLSGTAQQSNLHSRLEQMELLLMASALVSAGQVHSWRLPVVGFSPCSRSVDKQELVTPDLGVTKENRDTDSG